MDTVDSEEEQNNGQQVNRCFSGEPGEQTVCSRNFDPEHLQIESLSIVKSSSVQFGNNYYSGPVTINQIQTPPQQETNAQKGSPEKTGSCEESKKDNAWHRRFYPRSKRRRYVIGGTLIAGLTATFTYLIILIALTRSENSSNASYEYTKPFNDSDLHSNQTRIYEHSVWTHRKAVQEIDPLKAPVPLVIIAHSGTVGCSDFESCTKMIRGFQEYHIDTLNYEDIGYNFLIGGDGRIYEGRGWDQMGAHTYGYNRNSTGICVIGDFDKVHPADQQVKAIHKLIELGVQSNKISPDYRVLGQRQVHASQSPGMNLFALMTTWPHFGFQSSK